MDANEGVLQKALNDGVWRMKKVQIFRKMRQKRRKMVEKRKKRVILA
jgi:hypothetical protein